MRVRGRRGRVGFARVGPAADALAAAPGLRAVARPGGVAAGRGEGVGGGSVAVQLVELFRRFIDVGFVAAGRGDLFAEESAPGWR